MQPSHLLLPITLLQLRFLLFNRIGRPPHLNVKVTVTFRRQVPNLIATVRDDRKGARLDHPLEQAFLVFGRPMIKHLDRVCLPSACACAGSWYCEECAIGHWTNTSRARLQFHRRCSVRKALGPSRQVFCCRSCHFSADVCSRRAMCARELGHAALT